jgi:hypothetical protein
MSEDALLSAIGEAERLAMWLDPLLSAVKEKKKGPMSGPFRHAAFASPCRRCSTKIGCAHWVSFFFLLVMSVNSEGS